MIELLVKAVAGACVVVIIQLISRTRHYVVAGLVPMFPTLGLIAHFVVGTERTVAEFKETVLLNIFALIPYLIYLGSLYILADRVRLGYALGGATLLWILAAAILLAVWQQVMG